MKLRTMTSILVLLGNLAGAAGCYHVDRGYHEFRRDERRWERRNDRDDRRRGWWWWHRDRD